MAVKKKEEIINQLTNILGDNKTSDEAIALLEDVSDTLDAGNSASVEDLTKKLEEANKKLEDNDKSWREKYASRFNAPTPNPAPDPDPSGDGEGDDGEEEEPKTFGDLFSQE